MKPPPIDEQIARGAVTRVLEAVRRGEPRAADQLLPLVYDELRRLAAARLAREAPGQTLQPTALVHEAYLRLVGPDPSHPWDGRAHFYGAAAEAMRRILIDRARDRKRLKRGGDRSTAGAATSTASSPTTPRPTISSTSTRPSAGSR